jgi:hypothetical protein
MLTLLALGIVGTAELHGMVEVSALYEPDAANARAYGELYAEMVNLYRKTKAIHRRLNGASEG